MRVYICSETWFIFRARSFSSLPSSPRAHFIESLLALKRNTIVGASGFIFCLWTVLSATDIFVNVKYYYFTHLHLNVNSKTSVTKFNSMQWNTCRMFYLKNIDEFSVWNRIIQFYESRNVGKSDFVPYFIWGHRKKLMESFNVRLIKSNVNLKTDILKAS